MKTKMKKMILMALSAILLVTGTLAVTSQPVSAASSPKIYTGEHISTNTKKMYKLTITKKTMSYVYLTARTKNGQNIYMTTVKRSGYTTAYNGSTKKRIYGIKVRFSGNGRVDILYPNSTYLGQSFVVYKKSMSL